MIAFILTSFFTLALLGVPVGIVIALTTLFGFYYTDNTVFLSMISQRMFSAMDSFTFLALPFFLLAGDIMNKVGLTGRLVDFANLFFGRLKGGLAQVNIVTSIIFGGISGAAVADTAALGGIFIPSMTKQGYEKDFSTAVTVASSIFAPIIPPSIIMVLYGSIMEVSIADLFAAAQAHFYLSTPNVISAAEMEPWCYTDDVVVNPLKMENGAVKAPHSPGLGVTIDENQTARYSIAF